MVSSGDIGIITMAFGKQKYIDQAETLAQSLRLHMPGYKIAIVTDRTDVSDVFDVVVPLEVGGELGTVLKTHLYRYSPFEETFFIDSDCIVARPFVDQLEAIRRFDFSPVVARFLSAGDTDLWLRDVGHAIRTLDGTAFPKFNGGVYFFRKGPVAAEVFARAEELLQRTDELGILDFDNAGPGEETLIGLALSQMHITDLYNDHGRLMRTPLNSTGPIELDVLSGHSRFVKEGQVVEPAILHFCGTWITDPSYRIAKEELARGARLSAVKRSFTVNEHRARLLVERGTRKIRRLLDRSPV